MNNELMANGCNMLIKLVHDGEIDPSEAFAWIKKAEEELTATKKQLRHAISEEIACRSSSKEPLTALGYKITEYQKKEWGFDHIPAWLAKNEELLQKKQELKQIEELAKAIKEPMTFEATGEIIEPAICTYGEPIIKAERI